METVKSFLVLICILTKKVIRTIVFNP